MSVEALRDTPFLGEMLGVPYDRLKQEIITTVPPAMAWRPRSEQTFTEHCGKMMRGFRRRPRIEFWHAILIVMIRRRLELDDVLPLFYDLWESEAQFLCEHLTLRWLISASDTFCDHPRTPQEATAAISATMLLNTAKLYETERRILASLEVSPERLSAMQERGRGDTRGDGRPVLFEDIASWRIGYGDHIRNAKRRLNAAAASDRTPAACIFFAVADRLIKADTVFSRFRKMHVKEQTQW